MPIKVKAIAESENYSDKWHKGIKPYYEALKKFSLGVVSEEQYERGSSVPKREWVKAATSKESEAAYEKAIRTAVRSRRYEKGIKRVSDEMWKKRAAAIGGYLYHVHDPDSPEPEEISDDRCEYCGQLSLVGQRRCDYCNAPL